MQVLLWGDKSGVRLFQGRGEHRRESDAIAAFRGVLFYADRQQGRLQITTSHHNVYSSTEEEAMRIAPGRQNVVYKLIFTREPRSPSSGSGSWS